MYRNIRGYASLIAEGVKIGSLFSSISDCLGRSGRSQIVSKWLKKAAHSGAGFLTFIPDCYWITRLVDQAIAPRFTLRRTAQNSAVFLRYRKRQFEGDRRLIFTRQNPAKPGSFSWILRAAIAPELFRTTVEIASEIPVLFGGDFRCPLLGKVKVLSQTRHLPKLDQQPPNQLSLLGGDEL